MIPMEKLDKLADKVEGRNIKRKSIEEFFKSLINRIKKDDDLKECTSLINYLTECVDACNKADTAARDASTTLLAAINSMNAMLGDKYHLPVNASTKIITAILHIKNKYDSLT